MEQKLLVTPGQVIWPVGFTDIRFYAAGWISEEPALQAHRAGCFGQTLAIEIVPVDGDIMGLPGENSLAGHQSEPRPPRDRFDGQVLGADHFLQTGDGYTIECDEGTYWHSDLDLSGNYWGTTDIEEIAEGIYDCEDSDDTYHCVIFEPLADIVAVELRTWSAVKGLFE